MSLDFFCDIQIVGVRIWHKHGSILPGIRLMGLVAPNEHHLNTTPTRVLLLTMFIPV